MWGMTHVDHVDDEFEDLIEILLHVRQEMLALVERSKSTVSHAHPNHRESADNLLHYLALRGIDLRSVQTRLARLGLSSLGRAESHVLSTIDAVLAMLHRAVGREWHLENTGGAVDYEQGCRLLARHTEALLGTVPPNRDAVIMVTLPSEAADDYALVHALIESGMSCARINFAHDDVSAWTRMVEHVRRAADATGRPCRVAVDLAGPKLRTGPLEPGPPVLKIRPSRDAYGHVLRPARVWISDTEHPRAAPSAADATFTLPAEFRHGVLPGDSLTFIDARSARRTLDVLTAGPYGCWAETEQTCYLTPDVVLQLDREDREDHDHQPPRGGHVGSSAHVAGIPPTSPPVIVNVGDRVVLTRDLTPGRPAECDRLAHVLNPARIGCTSPQVFDDVRAGEHVWIDDGRIGCVVERQSADELQLRIVHAPPRGARIGADKGINFPDSRLRIDGLTSKDREDLDFARAHADMVALSFANSVEDVRALRTALEDGARQPGLVLKIETKRGFEQLPAMLLEAMKAPTCGVMIARGDLAVECGFERLAEVQEEILWLCEAAHVPAIWATQVLETLTKTGQPSRAEITDAAMSHRAECVMLNKGPFIVEAVQMLADILERMNGHQSKKSPMLRALHLGSAFRPPQISDAPEPEMAASHSALDHVTLIRVAHDATREPDVAQV